MRRQIRPGLDAGRRVGLLAQTAGSVRGREAFPSPLSELSRILLIFHRHCSPKLILTEPGDDGLLVKEIKERCPLGRKPVTAAV